MALVFALTQPIIKYFFLSEKSEARAAVIFPYSFPIILKLNERLQNYLLL